MAGKDPSKPERAASAFVVFLEEFRKQYEEQHPENKSVAAVGKAAGVKWKSMSDAEKAPYVNKSNKRNAELLKAVSAPEKKKNARSSNRPVGKAAGLKWKSMSDAEKALYVSKPKRAPSAFFAFLEEFRKQYNEQHPENKSIAAVGKAAGVKWKSMSVAEKASYISKPKRAPSAFFAFLREEFRKQYEEQHPENKSIAAVGEAAGVKWESMSDAEKASHASKPKRAGSAFFAFLEEFRKQYKEQHPENKSIAAVGKAAGLKWQSMSDAEKASYVSKPKRAPSAFFASPEEFLKQYNEQHSENKSIAAVAEAAGVKWKSMSDAEKASYTSKPMRAPSAFFAFLREEFRKQYEEQHPENKSIAAVGKAAGVNWKSMSDAEKASYVSKYAP